MATKSEKALEIWEDLFSQDEFLFGTEPNEYLVSTKQYLSAPKRVLLVADGEGRNSVWCAKQGLKVDAFDFSSNAIAKARKLAQQHQVDVNYYVSSIGDWPWQPEQYDAVIVIFAQFATPSMRDKLFIDVQTTLKTNGVLILQGYTPKQIEYKTGGPSNPAHLYTEELLKAYFNNMKILEMRTYDAIISEGPRHSGKSALIGMVAQKRECQ